MNTTLKAKSRKVPAAIAFVILLTLLAWLPAATQTVHAASVPGINEKITKSNIQKLLNKYDPNGGGYIINKQLAKGDNILTWFSNGDRIIDGIDTAVHEETHGYHYSYAKWPKVAYFIGNKKTVYAAHTKVYPSKKMASSIPKNLRTFRYNTYVGKPSKNLSSNVNGAYGLLDEFMAYRAGMSTIVSLYPYFVSQNANWDEWRTFITNCESDRLAYAEFKYYILHYLYYAKKHEPAVYRGILKNKEFCKAYRLLESSYANLIAAYEKDLKKMQNWFHSQGERVEITADYVYHYEPHGRTGIGRFPDECNKLQKETKKSKYLSIHKKLAAKGK